uniref:Uncharacterized protein n=1 Tax=Rhizophora mucronata TaxID=61149 RepID=A0A2P2J1J4_RHIMU
MRLVLNENSPSSFSVEENCFLGFCCIFTAWLHFLTLCLRH